MTEAFKYSEVKLDSHLNAKKQALIDIMRNSATKEVSPLPVHENVCRKKSLHMKYLTSIKSQLAAKHRRASPLEFSAFANIRTQHVA